MKNQAKCRLCRDVIESLALADIVTCSCGEITIWGGAYELRSNAKDYKNFLRISESGQEVEVKYHEKPEESNTAHEEQESISIKDLMYSLEASIKAIENLPDHAKNSSVTHYDMLSLMIVINELFKRSFPCG